jgi:sialic acid synthase SpsE
MIKTCQSLGIDTIKMQMFTVDMVPQEIRKCYIGPKRAKYFHGFAKENDIDLFFTCMYPEAVDICNKIGVKYHKIRFFDNRNLILYRKLKKTGQDLFISCQDPKETIFYNMSQYQERVKFLYCSPHYPATLNQYILENRNMVIDKPFDGVSDHTPDLELFNLFNSGEYKDKIEYFEFHVCNNKKTAYEGEWSKTFEELKEVLG